MPTYEITSPEGKTYEVSGPGTREEALAKVKQQVAKPALPSGVLPETMGAGERFMTGLADPMVGGSQMLTHLTGSPEQIKATDEQVKAREEAIKAREGGGFIRGVGGVVGAAPAMAVAWPIGGIPGALIGGALAGLTEPTVGDNYLEKKVTQGLMGAAFGGLGGTGTKVAGSLAGPTVREAADQLMKAGVKLTPGQIAGGILRRAEEAAKSYPILGSFIRNAENRSIEGYNFATINQALEPIKVKVPATIKPGHDAMTYGRARLDEAYEEVLPQLHLTTTPTLANEIRDLRLEAQERLPEAQVKHFEKLLTADVAAPFANARAQSPTGALTGRELKAMQENLTRTISDYRSSTSPGERDMARYFDRVKTIIRSELTAQNEKFAPKLKAIDNAYAMWTRIENAATRRTGSEAVFTPMDMLQSIKSADKTTRKGAFARGDALMQDFAEFANTVLPAKMADSGTPERIALMQLLAAGGGAVAGESHAGPLGPYLIPAASAMAAASAPYTKMGGAVVNKLAQPGPTRKAVGSAIRGASPYVGTASTPILNQIIGNE